MDHLVSIDIDGVAHRVLPRQAQVIVAMRAAMNRIASGETADVSMVEVRQDGVWSGAYSILDDGGFDRLGGSLEAMSQELRRRSLVFQGNAPQANRSSAKN